MTDRLLPEMWPLHRLAAELGRKPASLVAASRRGQFPPLVRIGRDWFVPADAMREWVGKNHVRSEAVIRTARELADQAAGCSGRRGRRRRARGSSDSFA